MNHEKVIAMGEIALLRGADSASSILGSCVGVWLYGAASRVGAIAHIVLPDRKNSEGPTGRFASSAIPEMFSEVRAELGGNRGVIAKIAGGASMLNCKGPLQVGEANIRRVQDILRELSIPVVGSHVGGMQGRRIRVYAETGIMKVQLIGGSCIDL